MATNPAPEEKMFADILASMGIDNYDPMLPTALNEYARRLASELLCDAKDYSNHAKKPEIDVDDIRLAATLSDTRVNGLEQTSAQLEELKKSVNQQNLLDFVDSESVLIRYPPGMFTKQTVTYVSSDEAYGEYYNNPEMNQYGNEQHMGMELDDNRYQYTGRINFNVSKSHKNSQQNTIRNVKGFDTYDD